MPHRQPPQRHLFCPRTHFRSHTLPISPASPLLAWSDGQPSAIHAAVPPSHSPDANIMETLSTPNHFVRWITGNSCPKNRLSVWVTTNNNIAWLDAEFMGGGWSFFCDGLGEVRGGRLAGEYHKIPCHFRAVSAHRHDHRSEGGTGNAISPLHSCPQQCPPQPREDAMTWDGASRVRERRRSVRESGVCTKCVGDSVGDTPC